jgi:hypothetical protein
MFSQSSFTFTASALSVYDFEIMYSNVMQISNLQNPWNIVTIPFNETVDKSDLIVSHQGIDYTWQEAVSNSFVLDFIYSWSRDAPQHYELVSTLQPGFGYWVFVYDDCILSAKDVSSLQNDGFITNLESSWNILGVPNDVQISKADIIVRYNGFDYSWSDATTSNNPTGGPIILGYIYNWSRDQPQHYELSNVFDPGFGYQMFAYYDCSLYYPIVGQLGIPINDNPGNILIGTPIQDDSIKKMQTDYNAIEWDALLELNEPKGSFDNVIFGESSNLYDSLDVPKSPSSLSPYLRAWFNTGFPDPFDELWQDYKPPSDYNIWDLYVQWIPIYQNSQTTITISWDKDSFEGCQYDSIVIMDGSTNKIVADLLIDDSYSFLCSASELQYFNILCSSNNNQPPSIPSNPSPSDSAVGIDIETTLDWSGGDPNAGDTISYDIYFGKDINPNLVKNDYMSTEFELGILEVEAPLPSLATILQK